MRSLLLFIILFLLSGCTNGEFVLENPEEEVNNIIIGIYNQKLNDK